MILKPLGHEKQTDLAIITALDVTSFPGATRAYIQCSGKSCRWRDDGTNPTATVGMVMIKDTAPLVYDGDLSAIRFIEAVAGADLHASHYA